MKYIALAVVLAVAGCQGASQPPSGGSALPSVAVPVHRHDLLYVSSFGGAVYAFTYPQGKLAGQLTMNYGAAGMCSDKRGNVYIVAPNVYSVYEFPHGGIFPIDILNEEDEGVLPYSCATDPKSGDLAVVNYEGGVEVYKGGSGKPAGYSLANLEEAFFCTYDDKDDLFVSGEGREGNFVLAELPEGSGSSKDISISASIAVGYGIAWNGKDLVLQSADTSGNATLLTVSVSGSSGTVLKTTTLTAPANASPTEFVLDGHTIVEPDSDNADVGFWTYPAGGAPTKTLQNVGSELIGVAISR